MRNRCNFFIEAADYRHIEFLNSVCIEKLVVDLEEVVNYIPRHRLRVQIKEILPTEWPLDISRVNPGRIARPQSIQSIALKLSLISTSIRSSL